MLIKFGAPGKWKVHINGQEDVVVEVKFSGQSIDVPVPNDFNGHAAWWLIEIHGTNDPTKPIVMPIT